MRRGLATVGLCLLLVLSGCSFLSGGTAGNAAPGVENGGLADARALLDAHESALTESGYSHDLTVNQSLETENRTLEDTQRQRMRVAAGASQYERQVIYGGRGRIIAWGNETVEYQRIESGGQTQYRRTEPESATAMSGVKTLEPLLSAPFEVVDSEETDGRTLVTLEATGQPSAEQAFPSNTTSVENFEARLVVDGDGRVHELSASAEYVLEGQPGGYEFDFELTSTDDPGVERPSWVDDIEE